MEIRKQQSTCTTTRDNINTKFPPPPMLMEIALGARTGCEKKKTLFSIGGVQGKQMGLRGDMENLVVISSRLVGISRPRARMGAYGILWIHIGPIWVPYALQA